MRTDLGEALILEMQRRGLVEEFRKTGNPDWVEIATDGAMILTFGPNWEEASRLMTSDMNDDSIFKEQCEYGQCRITE
jgi:hypothetical protein